MKVGIEKINVYSGVASIGVLSIFKNRGLNVDRFDNLMMKTKSMGLPCEDAVTCAVNAALKITSTMSQEDVSSIEMVICSSESGVDFGKSISTYVHRFLKLSRTCRLFEVKQACFGGTAALQQAVNFVASGVSPGAKVLVVATDIGRKADVNYAEPTQAIGAAAMLVSDKPDVLEIDFGAIGQYSYEVGDGCRPDPFIETGDVDLSLLSYLDCLENSYKGYEKKVAHADFRKTFDFLAFHTPFCGMVKGAHRKMLRSLYKEKPPLIEEDFNARVRPSLSYCQEIGNVYSATLYFSLCGVIDNAIFSDEKRIGLFSYGSGCSSEFFSGVVSQKSKQVLSEMNIAAALSDRYVLEFEQYDRILEACATWGVGIRDREVDFSDFSDVFNRKMVGKNMLVFKGVSNYERLYDWV